MKKLKFKPHLIQPILDGTKTITWRLFDDKNLQVGDHLELINSETGEKFAEVEIIGSREKQIKDLTDDDLRNNSYRDRTHVMEVNRECYGDMVNDQTVVKIIEFKLL
jgi:hypothetical protein